MKNLAFVVFIIAAYFAGYITPKNSVTIIESTPPEFQAEPVVEDTGQGDETGTTAMSSNKKPTAVTDKKPKTDADSQGNKTAVVNGDVDVGVNSEESAAVPPANVIASEKSSGASVKPLTAAEIDKLVPAPFNQYLKGHDAALLGKYRKFSEQENPSSQDSDILNKISDAIASNPYSKFLNIESFQCKANFCEIRLYESKSGVWSYIQAEMSLQDWWKFESSSAHGFETGKENINGWYVLLTRD